MEDCGTRQQGDRRLAGVDQLRVELFGGGRGTHAQQPVFAVEDDLAPRRPVVGDQRGDADAEVDIGPLRQVGRGPAGDGEAGGEQVGLRHAGRCQTWSMKMPGVITCSGSSAPSGTISRTSATLTRAAGAMTGP